VDEWIRPRRLLLDALYLGVLTARGVKPLSRIEYQVPTWALDTLRGLGVSIEPVMRFAANGTGVSHLMLGTDAQRLARYRREYGGTRLDDSAPCVVRAQARNFGYPACCAEAYIAHPYAQSGLLPEDQALLFHRACAGCVASPRLLPAYRAALAQAERLMAAFECSHGASQASRCSRTKASSRRCG